MKIAMLVDSHHPIKDGVVDAIDLLRKELTERGHEVMLIAPDPGEEDRVGGVKYVPSLKFKKFEYYLPVLPSLSLLRLKEMDPDVINVHGFAFMATRGVISGKLLRKPVVVTFHTPAWNFIDDFTPLDTELSVNVSWAYFRQLFKRADFTVAQTPSIAKELEDNGVKANIRVIPTGIDTERFRPGTDGSVIRERYGMAGKKTVIHVGRLSPEKSLDVMIKAIAETKDDDVVLMIVGKGALEKELKELAASLGISERVIFTGFVSEEELPMHYAAADAAASSSVYEAQCLAIMNAMACGLPVACPNGRAFVDFIEDGVNGFMHDASPEGCAAAIMKALTADRSVGDNARTTVMEYSIPRSVDSYISLFKEAAAKKVR
ncbi:MAG: glycosyltransferase [Methanomassiliicoccaceae archaeon]|jgi:1,2-diacylglycerol 3-alpha-glucosyltransferase|nr:glycosyltransferase [Methanomassiliicoccaceae archaeon]